MTAAVKLTFDEALDRLCALDTPELVRDVLLLNHAFGRRRSDIRCALAVYLSRFLGDGRGLAVCRRSLYVYDFTASVPVRVDLPPVLRDFIARFDCGHYPELEIRS